MRPMTRSMLMLALGCSMALPISLPLAGEAGREYSRCVKACNSVRQACSDRCDSDCAALYPNDPAQRVACESTCNNICMDTQKDCKAFCLAVKKGDVTPEEP